VRQRQVAHGIADASSFPAGPDSEHEAGTVTGSDEDVLRPGWAVDEIPCAEPPLLAFDQQQALAREHEEVLLCILSVVHPVRLARTENAEADPYLGEAKLLGFESPVEPELALEPARVPGVQDEPPLAHRTEAVLYPVERGLGNHGP
jgi:hypothetical protein